MKINHLAMYTTLLKVDRHAYVADTSKANNPSPAGRYYASRACVQTANSGCKLFTDKSTVHDN